MDKISIIGIGSYAMAMAHLLGTKGYPVVMWSHDEKIARAVNETHGNPEFLVDVVLPENISADTSLQRVIKDSRYILSLIPTPFIRKTIGQITSDIPDDAILINGAKGIEVNTLYTISEMFEEILPKRLHSRQAFISGPSFAMEVAQKQITALTVASYLKEVSSEVRDLLTTDYFKVFVSKDVIGVEICGSLKNIIAIAAGLMDGLGFGYNAQAAVITGGLAEITRIGLHKGANITTFLGLAGIGDLVLTCTGELSRNRHVGRELGRGKKLPEILSEMTMVAEGVKTTESAYKLAQSLNVKVPIIGEIYKILYEGRPPVEAVKDLMSRDLQSELGSTPLTSI